MQTDTAFKVESKYTCAAIRTSLALRDWWKESMSNEEQLTWFAHVLVRLQACFACKHTSIVLRKERFWGSYQHLRTSDTFVQSWKDFILKTVHLKAFPAFYQFVTQHIFDIWIKLEFPVNSAVSVSDSECVRPLTHQDRCPLRYVAGYIIRTVYEKNRIGITPKKEGNDVFRDGVCW